MGRERKVEVGAINIKTHPHSPMQYAELFEDVYEKEYLGKIRGSYYGIIGNMRCIEEGKPKAGLEGFFYRFMNLDPNAPWLNLESRKVLDKDAEGRPIIPDHIKPDLKRIPFVFFPKTHRLVFDRKTISPGSLQRLLESIFAHEAIIQEHGSVDVLVESSHESIERILKVHRKTKLTIKISKPNPDEGSDDEIRVLEKLGAQNADRLEHILATKEKDGLKPDDDTQILMRTARSNGVVFVEGKDEDGEKVEESTKEHPYTKTDSYNPDHLTLLEAVRRIAYDVVKEVLE
ncbi:hypothetical protein PDESU_01195 [Pontiella desulfatans]|uniref:DUF4747 domain-containing protein n=1 Tax=Pontiella desulfatans TaxID=2750659 RepID=A0A6C2TYC5_PONDE|nr:DUF4747 family protein [Pontiella desulfatans]VGO12642.1 hypothetical protein PDESU_01195 [Pontiella desulfatans]